MDTILSFNFTRIIYQFVLLKIDKYFKFSERFSIILIHLVIINKVLATEDLLVWSLLQRHVTTLSTAHVESHVVVNNIYGQVGEVTAHIGTVRSEMQLRCK